MDYLVTRYSEEITVKPENHKSSSGFESAKKSLS